MHISIVAAPTAAKTGLVIDNVSIVRIGASLPFVNGDFEKGNLSGWTDGGDPALSMVSDRSRVIDGEHALRITMASTKDAKSHLAYQDMDISGDPLGTRYIIRAEAISETLAVSYGMLEVRVQKDQTDSFDPKRKYFSNKVKPGAPSRLIRTVRKREKDESILRVSVVMSRPSTPEPCPSESIVFDDVQVHKVLPY